MANPAQWTVDEFYRALQAVQNQITAADRALAADKSRLATMYDAARRNMDPARDAYLAPLIHQNTVLRLSYLKPVKDDFRKAVNAASGALRSVGLTAPTLSGIGVLPAAVVVPVAAGVFLAACITAIVVVNRLTAAQINRTAAMAAIFSSSSTTPAQKLALAAQLQGAIDADRKASPPPFDPAAFVLPLGIIAAIVLGPKLLGMFGDRRSTA